MCRLFGELTDPLPYLSRNVGLSGNQLKIIALIAMTCDHVGKELVPGINVLQIVGRLAFPIFAYMIAEAFTECGGSCHIVSSCVFHSGRVAVSVYFSDIFIIDMYDLRN